MSLSFSIAKKETTLKTNEMRHRTAFFNYCLCLPVEGSVALNIASSLTANIAELILSTWRCYTILIPCKTNQIGLVLLIIKGLGYMKGCCIHPGMKQNVFKYDYSKL